MHQVSLLAAFFLARLLLSQVAQGQASPSDAAHATAVEQGSAQLR